jgi:hypothetical protein
MKRSVLADTGLLYAAAALMINIMSGRKGN